MLSTKLFRRGRSLLLVVVLSLAVPRGGGLHGQAVEAVAGGAFGAVAGAWWTLSIESARARDGKVVLGPRDGIVRAAPTVAAGLLSGVATGLWADDRVFDAIGWGTLGWAGGFGLGYFVGDLLWEDEPGKWAGGMIGSGLGLALGAVIGGLTGGDDPQREVQDQAPFTLRYSLRVGR